MHVVRDVVRNVVRVDQRAQKAFTPEGTELPGGMQRRVPAAKKCPWVLLEALGERERPVNFRGLVSFVSAYAS
jgi:hypothetical protein